MRTCVRRGRDIGWQLVAVLLLMPGAFAKPAISGTAAPAPVEHYLSATIDEQQQLHIVTSDHREQLPKPKKDQVGFQSAGISADQTTVGWLELYREHGHEDPIARDLAVYRDGKVLRTFDGNGLPILTWSFEAEGRQVAIFQNAVHGKFGAHYELRDVRTGKRLAKYDQNPGRDAPQWVLDVAN